MAQRLAAADGLNGRALPPSVLGLAGLDRPPVALEFIHPLTREITRVEAPEGATIAELLAAAGVNHQRWGAGYCYLEDAARTEYPHVLPRELWARVRPKAGTVTTVSLWPGRGGGGGDGKQILSTVLSIVIMIAAVALGQYYAPALVAALGETGGAIAAAAITTGVSVVTGLSVVSVLPAPRGDAPIALPRPEA